MALNWNCHATIRALVPAYPSGTYPSASYTSFARATWPELRAEVLRWFTGAGPRALGGASSLGFVVDLCEGCPTCNVTGKAPGCKRKVCPTCHGVGTVPVPQIWLEVP